MRSSAILLAAFFALGGCATPVPPVVLPEAVQRPTQEPMETALRGAAGTFASPGRMQGHPNEVAIAVAELEFLAVEIPAGRASRDFGSLVGPGLQAARHEVRRWLSIPEEAPPQAVIDALVFASAAPGGEGASRLSQDFFAAGGSETWRRLAALPRLPQANSATQRALRQWEFGPPQELIDLGV